MAYDFSVNFDYRCPFARNAHEHVLAALADGADYKVRFLGFSLSQAHVEEGGIPVWEDPEQRRNLVAVAAGIVVRDRYPELFPQAHFSLFAAPPRRCRRPARRGGRTGCVGACRG